MQMATFSAFTNVHAWQVHSFLGVGIVTGYTFNVFERIRSMAASRDEFLHSIKAFFATLISKPI